MELPSFSFSVKVLAWLDHLESKPETGSPIHASQAGITNATGLSRAHASRTVAPLVEHGWLFAERQRVEGFARSLLVYRLTPKGRERFQELSSQLASTQIETRRFGADPQMVSIGDALKQATPPLRLWDVIRQLEFQGYVDLQGSAPSPAARPRFISDIEDAPAEAPFIGRSAELGRFRTWFSGSQPLYVLEGPGGIGKTTFVHQAIRTCVTRTHVLWIRLNEWSTVPKVRARLDALMESLGRPSTDANDGDPDATIAALRRQLGTLPVLLVIDDAQKADLAVARLLETLVQVPHAPSRFRMILIGRTVNLPGQALRRATTERLPPLTKDEGKELLDRRGVAAPERERLVASSQGVPLLLELLARNPGTTGTTPGLTAQLFRDLLSNLPAAHWEILKWVSATRTPVDAKFLSSLRKGTPATLAELADAGLLVARADRRFEMHDVVRQAIYGQLEFQERNRIHEGLAEAYGADARDWSSLMEHLHHLVKAGHRSQAVRWVFANRSFLLARAQERFTTSRMSP